jgi:Zn-dependent peptidase ImmA (M78 family)
MSYNALLEEAFESNIMVKEIELKTREGLCYGNRIVINKKLKTNRKKRCVLAEELGHHYLTVGDITDQTKIENRKQELIARRWGYRRLIEIKDLIKAYESGIHNRYELAEYLDVTEQFLEDTINYYSCKYGLYYEIDNYIIYFEPLGIIKKFTSF